MSNTMLEMLSMCKYRFYDFSYILEWYLFNHEFKNLICLCFNMMHKMHSKRRKCPPTHKRDIKYDMNIQLISVNYAITHIFKFNKNITIPHNMLSWYMNNVMIIKMSIKLKYFSIVVMKPYKILQTREIKWYAVCDYA